MTESRTLEIVVGAFVLLGLLALLALSMQVSNLTTFSGNNGYEVTVKFDNIGGLKVRSPVKMAGVQIGRVSSIKLDGQTYQADLFPWSDGIRVRGAAPMTSPWRTIQMTDTPGGLIESNLILTFDLPLLNPARFTTTNLASFAI